MPEPSPDPRRRHLELERPEARRVGRLAVSLLGIGIVAIAAWGLLILWHLVRRGRLIRERLGPPRPVRPPEIETGTEVEATPGQPERRESETP